METRIIKVEIDSLVKELIIVTTDKENSGIEKILVETMGRIVDNFDKIKKEEHSKEEHSEKYDYCKIKVLMRQIIRAAKEVIEECEKDAPDKILICDIACEEIESLNSQVWEITTTPAGM